MVTHSLIIYISYSLVNSYVEREKVKKYFSQPKPLWCQTTPPTHTNTMPENSSSEHFPKKSWQDYCSISESLRATSSRKEPTEATGGTQLSVCGYSPSLFSRHLHGISRENLSLKSIIINVMPKKSYAIAPPLRIRFFSWGFNLY